VDAAPASAAKPCWKKVIDDWYDNGRIDGVYPQRCLVEARRHVPEDLRVYSTIDEELQNARQVAARASSRRPGGGSPRSTGSAGGSGQAPATRNVAEPDRGLFKATFKKLGPRNADSVPLPLLILAGLALLLISAGAAGLVARRLQARRTAVPPASPAP